MLSYLREKEGCLLIGDIWGRVRAFVVGSYELALFSLAAAAVDVVTLLVSLVVVCRLL